MSFETPQLALGTVQFGLAYGVAGRRDPICDSEIRVILDRAYELGIRTIDTAAAYGDVEERLRQLCGKREFSIFSKIPAKPADVRSSRAAEWAVASLELSVERLGDMLRGIMVHSVDDLLTSYGPNLWTACEQSAKAHNILLGVSCYAPDVLLELLNRRMAIDIAQLPGNAFDQRLRRTSARPIIDNGLELHLRSVFLQGLLLMSQSRASRKVPAASSALKNWHRWCQERSIDPLRGALAVAKSFPGVRYVVIGVDYAWQLEEIVAEWESSSSVEANELAIPDPEIIDPRRWPVH